MLFNGFRAGTVEAQQAPRGILHSGAASADAVFEAVLVCAGNIALAASEEHDSLVSGCRHLHVFGSLYTGEHATSDAALLISQTLAGNKRRAVGVLLLCNAFLVTAAQLARDKPIHHPAPRRG